MYHNNAPTTAVVKSGSVCEFKNKFYFRYVCKVKMSEFSFLTHKNYFIDTYLLSESHTIKKSDSMMQFSKIFQMNSVVFSVALWLLT